MSNISDVLAQSLAELDISSSAFSELLIRLLDYGVVSRDASQVETVLYDRYLRCKDLVDDYLAPLHLKLVHDRQFNFVRVFPPAAEVPGLADDDDSQDSPFQTGFRTKPSTAVITVILVLRVEYEKALREGKVDELGSVLLPMEQLVITMRNLLKQSLPEGQGERSTIFRQLKQLRLIKYASEDDLTLENSQDSWLSIEPGITSFVTQEMLEQLNPAQDEDEIVADAVAKNDDVSPTDEKHLSKTTHSTNKKNE